MNAATVRVLETLVKQFQNPVKAEPYRLRHEGEAKK
jgi:hypothetical protein